MKLRINPDAQAEALEAADWYEEQQMGLGLEFLAAVDDAVQTDPYRSRTVFTFRNEPGRGIRSPISNASFPIRNHLRVQGGRSSNSRDRTHSPLPELLERPYMNNPCA